MEIEKNNKSNKLYKIIYSASKLFEGNNGPIYDFFNISPNCSYL